MGMGGNRGGGDGGVSGGGFAYPKLQHLQALYLCSDAVWSKMQDSRKYTGIVEGCCCDYETVDSLNADVLHPLLQELVTTPFFRYFKVKLWCDCPFWPDDGMCKLRDCSVCECPETEFPESFKKRVLPFDDLKCQEGKPQAAVDRTLDSKAFRGWVEVDNPWTQDDETDNGEMTYVNLLLNPERYTGYTGPSARRIWDAVRDGPSEINSILPEFNLVYNAPGEICQEKKVLYKLISGLHSSISIHIAADYLLDETKNLATDYLEQAEYDTGNEVEDLKTQSLVRQLVYNPKLQTACPVPFDEAKLWKGQGRPELKQQIQKQFRNIRFSSEVVQRPKRGGRWTRDEVASAFKRRVCSDTAVKACCRGRVRQARGVAASFFFILAAALRALTSGGGALSRRRYRRSFDRRRLSVAAIVSGSREML
nr:Endoplasmic reticulum oxidoreductin-1 [Ipomoea batatas]